MSKIVLNDVTNLNALSVINDNFDKLEQELQTKVLYRDNPEGEPNTLENDVDANGNSLYNIQDLTIDGNFTVNGKSIEEVIDEATQGIEDNALAAQNAATAAQASAVAADASADAADVSEANALDSENAAAASASSASSSATSATSSASTATTQAGIATTKASEASTSASNAATSASTATTQAGIATTGATTATTQAGIATTQATNAASSASSASTSATSAANSAAAAAASAASIDPASLLTKAGNLSGLVNPATARDNLGVEIGVDVQAFNAALAAIAANNGTNAMKNRIINGDCRVAQRGAVSITGNSAPSIYGGCDRITALTYGFSTATATLQQSGSGFGAAGLSQALVGLTTTGSGGITFGQRIESVNIKDCNSNTVTVQAKVYQNTGSSQTLNLRLNKANSVDNFGAVTILSTSSSLTIPSGALTTVTATFSLGATDASNGILVEAFYSGLGALTSKDFHITDFQLEKGSTATSFDYRPYGAELALCQRYFEKSYNQNVAPGTINAAAGAIAVCWNPYTLYQGTIQFKVQKRATPTVTPYNDVTGASGTWNFRGSSSNRTVLANTLLESGWEPGGNNTWVANEYTYTNWAASAEL